MTAPSAEQERARRIVILRGSIKLLLGVGLIFLLVPFFKSIPWPESKAPDDAVLLTGRDISADTTLKVALTDGSEVFVTRSSAITRSALENFPAQYLWSVSAPGIATQEWLVVSAKSAGDEAVSFLPAQNPWPGGFVTRSGLAWDVAGRALKPWPGHPGASLVKTQNLMPMPFRTRGDDILLLPLPALAIPALEQQE